MPLWVRMMKKRRTQSPPQQPQRAKRPVTNAEMMEGLRRTWAIIERLREERERQPPPPSPPA
jgi:hypothetical protein